MSGTGLPLVMTAAGPQPTAPAVLRAQLLALVAATNPGYTANLPASLIEDVASTDVGALSLADSARVETVNSLTPRGANPFLLNQLGQVYGVPIGEPTNTSVFLVFTGPAGFVIGKGFLVSDGTHQYAAVDGGVVNAALTSDPLFFLATTQGSWPVGENTVTTLITSIPDTVGPVTATNPIAGIPGVATGETEESYRLRVLQAGLAASQGMSRYLKTLLGNVDGTQTRLISVRQKVGIGWEVICGGGDPYAVAFAIFQALFDINTLVGSVISITGATKVAAAVITTDLNHGLANGQTGVVISGAIGMTGINGTWTVTVLSEKTFSIPYNSSAAPTYTGGGILATNARNVVVDIDDYPDTYAIPFVNPPQQAVTMNVTWNTSATNFVSETAVAQLAIPALTDYVNSVGVGQPINLIEMATIFQAAITPVLAPDLLVRLVFQVNINGITTSPSAGESVINGDPESYFFAAQAGIIVSQG